MLTNAVRAGHAKPFTANLLPYKGETGPFVDFL